MLQRDGQAWQRKVRGRDKLERERDNWEVMVNCQFGFWWISIRKVERLGILGLERSKWYVIKKSGWVLNCYFVRVFFFFWWIGLLCKLLVMAVRSNRSGVDLFIYLFFISFPFSVELRKSCSYMCASFSILTIFVNKYSKLSLIFKWYFLYKLWKIINVIKIKYIHHYLLFI